MTRIINLTDHHDSPTVKSLQSIIDDIHNHQPITVASPSQNTAVNIRGPFSDIKLKISKVLNPQAARNLNDKYISKHNYVHEDGLFSIKDNMTMVDIIMMLLLDKQFTYGTVDSHANQATQLPVHMEIKYDY